MDQIAELDRIKATEFFRSESRPEGRSTRSRSRPSDDLRKAKDRLRAASRRVMLDKIRQPEAGTIGMELLKAICTAENSLDTASAGILQTALLDLQQRGFAVAEVLTVCKRLRKRWQ